jgi:hypothetical protein
MPFRKNCRLLWKIAVIATCVFFYQIDYMPADIPENAGYFHAQFHRVNPLSYKTPYMILDGVKAKASILEPI